MRAIYLVMILFVPWVAWAQKENLETTLIDQTDPGRWLYVSPEEPPGVRGNQYLFENWQMAELTLNDQSTRPNIFINYDLDQQSLDMYTQDGIKVIPDGLVYSFIFKEKGVQQTFMHYSRFSKNQSCLGVSKGYFEVLYKSEVNSLVSRHSLLKKDPSYNDRLGVGDNNMKLIKEDELWLLHQGGCETLPASGKKREKKLTEVFRDSRLSQKIKKNNLHLKDDEDIVALIKLLEM